jgi:predicted RNA methylase
VLDVDAWAAMTTAPDPHDEFDLATGWHRFVAPSHLPEPIRRHLRAERDALTGILAAGRYRTVIEAGCADGSLLLPAVLDAGLDYLGVDVVPQAVTATRQAIRDHAPLTGRATAVLGDVRALDAGPEIVAVARGALLVLPFNLVGILSRPDRAFASAAAVGADIAVMSYRRTPEASAARADYFRRAGWSGRETETPEATDYRADHFVSTVYGRRRLCGWLTGHGFRPDLRTYGRIGLCALGVRP